MNKGHFLLLSVVALFAGAGASPGQEIPPPKEPILPRAPQRAEWTVEFRLDRELAKKEVLEGKEKKEVPKGFTGFPAEIAVSKDGSTYREIARWPDGRTVEKWIVGGLQVSQSPDGRGLMRIPSIDYSPYLSDYSRSDFEEAEWIGKDSYVGPKVTDKLSVYEFSAAPGKRRLTPREIADQGTEAASGASAALDIRTQLPVYVDDGTVVRIYRYAPAPTGTLVPPQNFAQEFEAWKSFVRKKTPPPILPP